MNVTLKSETISVNWKSFNNNKKCFLCHHKISFLFLIYLHFCPDYFGHIWIQLDKKAKFILKFMASQIWKQIMTVHILFIILEVEAIRNCFEKSFTKCGWETSSRPFLKTQNRAYLWVNSLSVHAICFYCMSKLRATNIKSI